ncbi:hypothetical protein QC762_409590 [Podospora pseudocomata]|uniref:C2H2-type domain-containing protein n=1 Tax=Podospora pseudocomata TaxID=2093779 RepID=A0ABR0GFK0_9PEZI|nr:hypothetical protein QC762_409590 [Podospora pseudocomata]
MRPLQSIETPAPATADENGETRQQKPKTLPCKYCSKCFRRVEHVQRHERTHTKEKPFSCEWPRCGKHFGRRDLLSRHHKLVHSNEAASNRDGGGHRPRKPSTAGAGMGPVDDHGDVKMLGMQPQPQQQQQQQPQPPPHQMYRQEVLQPTVVSPIAPDPRMSARAPACNLDLLSDAATHLASAGEVSNMQPSMMSGISDHQPPPPPLAPVKTYHDSNPYGDRVREQDPGVMSGVYQTQPAPFEDYNLFLDDYGTQHFLPPGLEMDQGFGSWSRLGGDMRGPSKPASAFPSRFPSLQPDARDPNDGSRMHEDGMQAPNWRIAGANHIAVKNRLDEFSSVLPNDFVFPSRHTLNRFLDGYISGFHEHLPFLHLPSLAPIDLAPELLLAVLAVGAQYRFETNRGHALWYAAKAVALEQIRRRHSHEVHGLLPTPAAYSPHSTRPSPSSGFRHSFPSVHQDRPMTQETHREPYSPNTPHARLETIQAILLLFSVGLWGPKAILQEALGLQSQLAVLVREEGLVAESNQQTVDHETWVRHESATRTKLVAFCFFNLCSIAYNTPPMLLTSDVHLFLPSPSRLWRAETSWQWQEARQTCQFVDITLQDAFMRLLNRSSQVPPPPLTSLGNYVLIHALIQHIFLLKQTSFTSLSPYDFRRGMKPEDVEDVTHALRVWQTGVEQHRQIRTNESGGPASADNFSGGPVAFNSAALLRLAYIRLYTDLSPSRSLETRDHVLIASAFSDAPLLVRNKRLNGAVVPAVHALAHLVKVGVNYVARTKSLEWSMQHSLCNLECAILLSKWLLTLSAIGPADQPLSVEEKHVLDMVCRMLDETEFAVPIDPSLGGGNGGASSSANHHGGGHHQSRSIDMNASASTDSTKLRQLACAVVRLWAETFKGAHIFEILRIMAAGLDGYGDLIEKPRDRTPLGKFVGGQGLG